MGVPNKVEFPLPVGFKDNYPDIENAAIFVGNALRLTVHREDYNAPNPRDKQIKEGINAPIVTRTINYYTPEIVTRDARSIIKDVLVDLEEVGNLDTQSVILANQNSLIDIPPIVMYDYHRFDRVADRERGYTIRVGTIVVEDLKGTFRSSSGDNHGEGTRIVFTHIYDILGTDLVDARYR